MDDDFGAGPLVGPDEVLGVDVLVDARAPERFRGGSWSEWVTDPDRPVETG